MVNGRWLWSSDSTIRDWKQPSASPWAAFARGVAEPAEGRVLLERALALAGAQDDPALIAEVCGILASACAFAGDLQASVDLTLVRERCSLGRSLPR